MTDSKTTSSNGTAEKKTPCQKKHPMQMVVTMSLVGLVAIVLRDAINEFALGSLDTYGLGRKGLARRLSNSSEFEDDGDQKEDVPAAAQFVLLVLAGIVTKLTSSIDDIVWLLPFVSRNNRAENGKNACIYVFMMCLVACIASAAAVGGRSGIEQVLTEKGFWTSERVLGLTSGVLLSVYAIFLVYEWWFEEDEGDSENDGLNQGDTEAPTAATVVPRPEADATQVNETKSTPFQPPDIVTEDVREPAEVAPASSSAIGIQLRNTKAESRLTTPSADDLAAPAKAGARKKKQPNLGLICILGSLDDFSVFVSILLGGIMDPFQLICGVFLGSCIVVGVCSSVQFCEPVVQIIEKIPLFAVITVFAVYTIVSTMVL